MGENDTYIVSARRTPIGAFLGSLKDVPAPLLGSTAIRAALTSANLEGRDVGEVYMGNVLSAGLGQAPARQAALAATIPSSVPTTTVSKVCGSGLQAVILARRAIALGDYQIVVAGGMESMSRCPHYLPDSRHGTRLGRSQLVDGIILDGLWDPYNDYHMGQAGELCARTYKLSRESQDAFAAKSYHRALAAQESGAFDAELVGVSVDQGKKFVVSKDEEPGRGRPEKFSSLLPAFDKEGTITAANASSINDGAAALLLASGAAVKAHGLAPLAKVVATGAAAQDPKWFTTAPVAAIERALAAAKLQSDDIDLWEINEAFSCVTMACSKLTGLDPAQVNVRGGAVALGHPIGASGARILVTLVHALIQEDKESGLATLCIGGGEAVALIIQRP